MECKKFVVKGRVQGVFFRASTKEQAAARDITGHAVNLSDGSVEVVACGESDKLHELERWLWQGPLAADVTSVQAEDLEMEPLPDQFTTG